MAADHPESTRPNKKHRSAIERVIRKMFSPKVDEKRAEEILAQASRNSPAPLFWLLGKAQSGKTSLVRALTGNTKAEIGNGFKPCTRTASIYAFPSETDSVLRFLDTRGLGEVGYDPSEDIEVFEQQAHVLIVVVKAADHALQPLIEALGAIRKAHPMWPVIVVQTTLHELYPSGFIHLDPYPFDTFPFERGVPNDLARSLIAQRECFASFTPKFVPVDFTLPGDQLRPEDYGRDALWSAIEDVTSSGLIHLLHGGDALKPLTDECFRIAHPHIISYATVAGLFAGATFVPLVDIPAIAGIQVKMLHSVASAYGQDLSSRLLLELVTSLGLGLATRQVLREGLKFIPGLGAIVAGANAAASTYALGCAMCQYFKIVRTGGVVDPTTLKRIYKQQFAEAFQRFKVHLRHVPPGDKIR
jgi:uncharacterized protein (DUF697 family)